MYKYDHRNRMVEKKLPGVEAIYYVYDKADRLVAEQDSYWRSRGSWKVMLYDGLGRLVRVMRYKNNLIHSQIQNKVNTYTGAHPFPVGTDEVVDIHALSYDDPECTDLSASLDFSDVPGVVSSSQKANPKGLLVYDRMAIVDSAESDSFTYIWNRYYYDNKHRLLQKVTVDTQTGRISRISFQYDFVGNITKKHESHQTSSTATADILLSEYYYDIRDKLIQETTTLNGSGKGIVKYTYDDLGRISSKTFGEKYNVVGESYNYNIQGWPTGQSSNLFSTKLLYYDKQKSATPVRYTGNITEWEWQHKGAGADKAVKNTYAFTYDHTGRLLDTKLYEGTGSTATSKFTEQGISYDRNGNIKTLKRYSSGAAPDDEFNYSYNGNQLTALSGDGVEVTALDFPGNGYTEYNNWGINMNVDMTKALINTPANGFGGAYERFDVKPGGSLRLSVYNTFIHGAYLPRKDVILTVQYRCNYDVVDLYTGRLLFKANTGSAKTVSFSFEGSDYSIASAVAAADAWMEIRTIKIEHRATPMDFPCEGFSEENNWETNHAIYTSKAIKQTPVNGFSGAYSRFEAIPGGTLRPSVYNSYVHNKSLRYTPLVITIEYRSNYPLSEKATGGKILIPANTGNAKRVSFSFDDTSFSLLTTVAAADAWMEIRTIKIEKKNAEGGTIYHYAYDANGNMTTDGLHGLTLEYNHMNLVQTVKEGNTVKAGYRWLADGTKTGVNTSTGFTGTGYEYLGSLVYKRTGAALSLESASFGGGRIIRSIGSTATYTPYYFITDHLGSTRVIIVGSSSYPRFNYYPFGGDWNSGMERSENRYLYNGKESQKDFGITYLDYGARMYDPRKGRWDGMDPLAEKYFSQSPYGFCGNNPIMNIDLTGLAWEPVYETGTTEDKALRLIGYRWVPKDQSYDSDGNMYEHLTPFGAVDVAYGSDASALIVYRSDGTTSVRIRTADGNYTGPAIERKDPSWAERIFFGSGIVPQNGIQNFVSSFFYNYVNDLSVAGQMLSGVRHPVNLDGSYVLDGKRIDHGIDALLSGAGRLVRLAGAGKTVNAGQFNALNRGSGVTAATNGGQHIRSYNNSVRSLQQASLYGESATTALSILKSIYE